MKGVKLSVKQRLACVCVCVCVSKMKVSLNLQEKYHVLTVER